MSRLLLPLLLFACLLTASLQRCKDDGDAKNVLEVLVVLDKPVHSKWTSVAGSKNKAKQELYSTFLEVDEIFKSLCDHGVELEVRVKDVITPEVNVLGEESTGQISPEVAMDGIRGWLGTQEVVFDQVVFFVDSQLVYDSSDPPYTVSGYTMMGGVCQGYGVSIVTAGYDYGTVSTLASLLAQSLEVSYDGQGEGQNFDPGDGYVMSYYNNRQSLNRWSFSSCSASQIQEFVSDPKRGCLQRTTASTLSSAHRFGQLVGGNETCERLTGKYLMSTSYGNFEAEVCNGLNCLEKIEGNRYSMIIGQAPEGMTCGQDKQCHHGVCESDDSGY